MPIHALVAVECAVTLALTLKLLQSLYEAFFGPLSRIPQAHFTVPYVRAWILWVKWTNCEHHRLRELHTRLGPVIRIGPQEISINGIGNGVRTVYGGNYEKSAWYSGLFHNHGSCPMFAMRDNVTHASRKRMLWRPFAKSSIWNSPRLEKILYENVFPRFIARINTKAERNGQVEVIRECHALSFDLVSAWLFGLGNGTNLQSDEQEREAFLNTFRGSFAGSIFRSEYFSFTEVLHRIGLYRQSNLITQSKKVFDALCIKWSELSCNERKSGLREASLCSHLNQTLESSTPSGKLRSHRVASEMQDHILGSETLGTTFLYLLYELSKRPDIQRDIRNELTTSKSPSGRPNLSPHVLESSKLLDAVVKETLRFRTPTKGPFPRVVPKGGARLGQHENIPAGTIVSASAYCLHHDESIFFRPDEWRPERWLFAEKPHLQAMNSAFWAFGGGSRMCIANHFSLRVLKAFVATICSRFDTSIVHEEDMEQEDGFIAPCKATELFLKFHEVPRMLTPTSIPARLPGGVSCPASLTGLQRRVVLQRYHTIDAITTRLPAGFSCSTSSTNVPIQRALQ